MDQCIPVRLSIYLSARINQCYLSTIRINQARETHSVNDPRLRLNAGKGQSITRAMLVGFHLTYEHSVSRYQIDDICDDEGNNTLDMMCARAHADSRGRMHRVKSDHMPSFILDALLESTRLVFTGDYLILSLPRERARLSPGVILSARSMPRSHLPVVRRPFSVDSLGAGPCAIECRCRREWQRRSRIQSTTPFVPILFRRLTGC